MSEKTKKWIKAAAIRAVKTVAQTAIATIGTSAVMGDVNWQKPNKNAIFAVPVTVRCYGLLRR